jgi:adenylosuccinate synthase
MLTSGKVNFIIDGQWGSTGKGKLAGFLALHNDISAATADFQPNAGHTWKSDTGEEVVTSFLPSSLVNKSCKLYLNAASTIDVDKFLLEMERYADYGISDRLMIHPKAGVIHSSDVRLEKDSLSRISSTMKGSGAALCRKVLRSASLAHDEPRLSRWIGDTVKAVHGHVRVGNTVLAETAQGFDLSLNHGHAYPYTTSRDVTTGSCMNNVGIPPQMVGRVYGSLRTLPIRVGSLEGTTSGPCHPDQKELSWHAVEAIRGAPVTPETTTVTGRQRRIFTWSRKQLEAFVRVCGPTDLFVNFMNYVDATDYEKRDYNLLTGSSKKFVQGLRWDLQNFDLPFLPRVSLLGTGPADSDMVIL